MSKSCVSASNKFISILLSLVLCFTLVGCSTLDKLEKVDSNSLPHKTFILKTIGHTVKHTFYYDKDEILKVELQEKTSYGTYGGREKAEADVADREATAEEQADVFEYHADLQEDFFIETVKLNLVFEDPKDIVINFNSDYKLSDDESYISLKNTEKNLLDQGFIDEKDDPYSLDKIDQNTIQIKELFLNEGGRKTTTKYHYFEDVIVKIEMEATTQYAALRGGRPEAERQYKEIESMVGELAGAIKYDAEFSDVSLHEVIVIDMYDVDLEIVTVASGFFGGELSDDKKYVSYSKSLERAKSNGFIER